VECNFRIITIQKNLTSLLLVKQELYCSICELSSLAACAFTPEALPQVDLSRFSRFLVDLVVNAHGHNPKNLRISTLPKPDRRPHLHPPHNQLALMTGDH
jgi:hypothetical protein